jgi:glycosyltransferase involved in cell wall biosynthesis
LHENSVRGDFFGDPMAVKKILIVTYYYPPMLSIATQRLLALSRKLSEKGWAVSVLSVDPGRERIAETKTDMGLNNLIPEGVAVYRVGSQGAPRKPGTPSAIAFPLLSLFRKVRRRIFLRDPQESWTRKAAREAEGIVAREGIGIVLVSVPPHSLLALASRLHRRLGIPVVTDFRDNWTTNDEAVFPTPLHRWIAFRTEKTAISRSSLVITVQKDLLETWKVPVGLHVPNGYDEGLFPSEESVTRLQKYTISYLGSLYGGRNPEALFRAVGVLAKEIPRLADSLSVEFWGWNWNTDLTRLTATHETGSIIRAMGVLKYKDSLMRLCQSDMLLLVIPKKKGAGGETVFTGKLFEYMYSGNPILALAPTRGAAADVIRAHDAGFVVDAEDWEGVRDVLRAEINAYLHGTRRKVHFRHMEEYSRSTLNARVEQALVEIAERRMS